MKKILVIKPSSLGDIIHGLVVAQSLREQMPGCQITWVARERFAPVVQTCPTVDHTVVFERRGGVRGFLRMVRALRREHYDYALDFQGLARSALMLIAARARMKIGRADAREGAVWTYRHRPSLPSTGRRSHQIDILLNFLPLLGLEPRLGSPIRLATEPLPPPHDRLLASRPIVLTPNSREPAREWRGFVELTRLLLDRHPGIEVVWDSHKKWETPPDFASNPRFHNLTTQTSVAQMIGLIQSARLVVVNDSGPMHIAAAVGTPLVLCSGPTLPECSGPYPLTRPTHRIARAPTGSLADLPVEAVYAEVARLLKAGLPAGVPPQPEPDRSPAAAINRIRA